MENPSCPHNSFLVNLGIDTYFDKQQRREPSKIISIKNVYEQQQQVVTMMAKANNVSSSDGNSSNNTVDTNG